MDRLREAAVLAGIGDPVFVSEPEAAAWFYAPPVAGQVVAVFDLGGGTLDTAVLRAADGGFEIAGPPGGDAGLGGEDFDELLTERVREMALALDEELWAVLAAPGKLAARDRANLRSDVTAAKEALSEHLSYEVVVPGFDEGLRVTRPEFEELIGEAVDRAVDEMRRTISAAGIEPAQLAGVYLTGGSSRIPLIAGRLWAAFGVKPQLRDDPKAVVVLGALKASAQAAPRERGSARKPVVDGVIEHTYKGIGTFHLPTLSRRIGATVAFTIGRTQERPSPQGRTYTVDIGGTQVSCFATWILSAVRRNAEVRLAWWMRRYAATSMRWTASTGRSLIAWTG